MAQTLHDTYSFSYDNLKVLQGGWTAWEKAGYPIAAAPTAVPTPALDDQMVAARLREVYGYNGLFTRIDTAHLSQQFHLRRTLGAYTVTMLRLYADTNHVVLGYIVQGPAGQRLMPGNLQLSAADGTAYPFLTQANGFDPATPAPGVPSLSAYVTGFLVPRIVTGTLNLHLSLSLLDLTPLRNSTSSGTSSPTATPGSVNPPVAAGPLDFDFYIPVYDAETRIVEVHNTVTAAGIPITLDQVIVTPGMTRALLRFPSPRPDLDMMPAAGLQVSSGNRMASQPVSAEPLGPRQLPDGHWSANFAEVDNYTQGAWTLLIPELHADDTTQQPAQEIHLSGPWQFPFTVPPAGP